MVKRVVDTDFWTDMDVIDSYSPEDKYFYLYLITNGKSSQVGIYSLPIKVISFETGYSTEAVKVLLERFSERYKQIIYSNETQEVTILNSLKFSILKGGKPVKDLLEKELALVKDAHLIQATHENMLRFWELSKRPFDKTIKVSFENELRNRRLMCAEEVGNKESMVSIKNENHNVIKNVNHNDINNDIKKKNDNDNEESGATNHNFFNIDEILKNNLSEKDGNESETTNRHELEEDEIRAFKYYGNIIKKHNPTLQEIDKSNIVKLYYEVIFGEMHPQIENQLNTWQEQLPVPLILDALSRSIKASVPIPYANSILQRWVDEGIKCTHEVLEKDIKFKEENF